MIADINYLRENLKKMLLRVQELNKKIKEHENAKL